MEGDHIRPWREGWSATNDNLPMTCRPCNFWKGTKLVRTIAEAEARAWSSDREAHAGSAFLQIQRGTIRKARARARNQMSSMTRLLSAGQFRKQQRGGERHSIRGSQPLK